MYALYIYSNIHRSESCLYYCSSILAANRANAMIHSSDLQVGRGRHTAQLSTCPQHHNNAVEVVVVGLPSIEPVGYQPSNCNQ